MKKRNEVGGELEKQMEDRKARDQRQSDVNRGEDGNVQDSQMAQGDQEAEQPSPQCQRQEQCSGYKCETYQHMTDSDTHYQMQHDHEEAHQLWQSPQQQQHQQHQQQQQQQNQYYYPTGSMQYNEHSPFYYPWSPYSQFSQRQPTFPQPYCMPSVYGSTPALNQQQHLWPRHGSLYGYSQSPEGWHSMQNLTGTGVEQTASEGQLTEYQDQLQHGEQRPPTHSTPPESEAKEERAKEYETSDPDKVAAGAVQVTGFSNNTDTDILEMYFENKKRSGGGNIRSIDKKDDHTIVITFEDRKDAKAVLSRANHVIEGATLKVKEVPVPLRDKHSFVLNGVPSGTEQEDLQMYLENCTKLSCEPDLFFGDNHGSVLVKYPEEIEDRDFEVIVKRVTAKLFMGAKLTINPINRTNCILVRHLPSGISSTYIQLYFENRKRSGGGDVVEVDMDADGMSAFVLFHDYRVVDSVLKQKHQIDSVQVDVQPYHASVGRIVSREKAPTVLPGPISLHVDKKVIKFVRSDDGRFERLANEVVQVHGRLEIIDGEISDHITVHPTFSPKTASFQKLVNTWAKDVTAKVHGHLKQYKTVSIDVSDEIWLPLRSKLRGRGDFNPDLDEDTKSVVFTSTVEEANKFENAVKTMVHDIEKNSERQRQIRSETMALKKLQVKQLDVAKFSEKVKEQYPDVKVVMNKTNPKVTFKGVQAQLLEAKCFMLETLNHFHTVEMKLASASLRNFLVSEDVCDEIYKVIRENKLDMAFTVEYGEVRCLALSKDEAKRGMQVIQNSVAELEIDICPQSENALKQDGWSAMLEKLQGENTARIAVTNKDGRPRVTITALRGTAPRVEREINQFIKLHTLVEKAVVRESGKLRFVSKFKSVCLEQLKNGKLQPVQVIIKMEGRSGSLTVRGTEDDTNQAVLCVTKLLDEILHDQFTVGKPGIPKLFSMEKGKSYIQSIQNKYGCLIEVSGPADEGKRTEVTVVTLSTKSEDEEQLSEEDERELAASPEATTINRHPSSTHFITDEGKAIRLVKGNIANQTADVIVNTVRTTCNLDDAVISQAILQEAGQQLQVEIDTKKHSVNEGDVIVTGSGNLSCRAVYHACILGTPWEEGFEAELRLRHVLQTCLDYAHQGKMTSIAIPAIGTGNLGYPKSTTARIFYDEVKIFSRKRPKSSLSDIRIVVYDKDTPTCEAFEDEMVKLSGTTDLMVEHGPTQDVPTTPSPIPSSFARFKRTFISFRGSTLRQKISVDAIGQDQTRQSIQAYGKTITLVKGNLVDEQVHGVHVVPQLKKQCFDEGRLFKKVDAMVNTIQSSCVLKSGVISRAILKAAGQQLQTEFDHVKPKTVKLGDMIATGGANLKCRKLYHVFMLGLHWDGGKECTQLLRDVVKKCLDAADRDKITSIAFPAIGTGVLEYPSDTVAEILYNEVIKFSASNPKSTLTDIRIVVFDKNLSACKAFEDKMQKLRASLAPSPKTPIAKRVGSLFPPPAESSATIKKVQKRHADCQQTFWDALEKPVKPSFLDSVKKLAGTTAKMLVCDQKTRAGCKMSSPLCTVVFDVYGEKKTDIQNAIKSIKKHVEEEFVELDITHGIKKITDEQMKDILRCAKSHDVEVEYHKKGGTAGLILRGLVQDVMHVNAILEKIKTDMQDEANRKIPAQNVTWEYEDVDGQFERYDENINGIIEMEFYRSRPNVDFNIDGQKYRIDFKKMEEVNLDDPCGQPTKVRRELKEDGVQLPAEWVKMANDEQVRRVTLDPKSYEYKEVEKRMMESYTPASFIRIERIQNPKLYRQYCVEKQSMDNRNKPRMGNEKRLFHGTAEESIEKINATGFNRSFAGKNAAKYGNGTYFALKASYSATFSKANSKGHKYVYLARVLTGEFTLGRKGYLVPPAKGDDPTDCYDSVVDNPTSPSKFVVFNDAMAYPEYLVTFS